MSKIILPKKFRYILPLIYILLLVIGIVAGGIARKINPCSPSVKCMPPYLIAMISISFPGTILFNIFTVIGVLKPPKGNFSEILLIAELIITSVLSYYLIGLILDKTYQLIKKKKPIQETTINQPTTI